MMQTYCFVRGYATGLVEAQGDNVVLMRSNITGTFYSLLHSYSCHSRLQYVVGVGWKPCTVRLKLFLFRKWKT